MWTIAVDDQLFTMFLLGLLILIILLIRLLNLKAQIKLQHRI